MSSYPDELLEMFPYPFSLFPSPERAKPISQMSNVVETSCIKISWIEIFTILLQNINKIATWKLFASEGLDVKGALSAIVLFKLKKFNEYRVFDKR